MWVSVSPLFVAVWICVSVSVNRCSGAKVFLERPYFSTKKKKFIELRSEGRIRCAHLFFLETSEKASILTFLAKRLIF